MNDYTASTYGDRIAERYDRMHSDGPATQATVNVLAGLAAGGRALELGIGTGRVALPLAARGVEVHGIDASRAMVAKLRAKPGGGAIAVTIGDFAAFQVDGRFDLIFVVFNTFFELVTQEAQVQCYRHVAAHLSPGGVFLIEAFVPDPGRFTRGQSLGVTRIDPDLVSLDVARHDPVAQRVYSQHLIFTESGTRLYPVQLRYAWPSELDLMARLAGLRLERIYGSLAADRRLAAAVARFRGMRVLRQDPWECLISFLCSAASNIPRISSNIESICRTYGPPLGDAAATRHGFPTPEQLAAATESELRSLGLGYRAAYLTAAAHRIAAGNLDLYALREAPYEAALEALLSLHGVGDKVANCVLLFAGPARGLPGGHPHRAAAA